MAREVDVWVMTPWEGSAKMWFVMAWRTRRVMEETGRSGVEVTVRAWAVKASKSVVVPREKEDARCRRATAEAEMKKADCTGGSARAVWKTGNGGLPWLFRCKLS